MVLLLCFIVLKRVYTSVFHTFNAALLSHHSSLAHVFSQSALICSIISTQLPLPVSSLVTRQVHSSLSSWASVLQALSGPYWQRDKRHSTSSTLRLSHLFLMRPKCTCLHSLLQLGRVSHRCFSNRLLLALFPQRVKARISFVSDLNAENFKGIICSFCPLISVDDFAE